MSIKNGRDIIWIIATSANFLSWTQEASPIFALTGSIQRALDEENIGLNQAFKSEDFAEAVKARIQKRDPIYKGK